MRNKTIVNGKGKPQATRIEIPIEGGGGALGMQAVTNLTTLIGGLKDVKTEEELKTHIYMIYGYAACCQQCGFMTEKNTDDLMHMAECLADNELIRIKATQEKAGNDSP